MTSIPQRTLTPVSYSVKYSPKDRPRGDAMHDKIWANSGDSHFLEPADLFQKTLPPALADRMPRSVKSESGDKETVYIDGESFERPLPRPLKEGEFKGETIETLS